jgi:hypothetical protein
MDHDLTDEGIRPVFRSNMRFDIQLYDKCLDVSRFGGPAHGHVSADYLRHKYSGNKIDAIIVVYPAALDFLMRKEDKVFPGVSIVACEIFKETAEEP